jgi:phosphatidylglycerol:prolipoprotein diacylglycerol transferase
LRGVAVHPTQLYEALFLIIFAIVAGIYLLSKRYRVGKLYPLYMIGYGLVRFIIENFRGDSVRGAFMGFSTSQWVAVAILIGSLPFFYRNYLVKSE